MVNLDFVQIPIRPSYPLINFLIDLISLPVFLQELSMCSSGGEMSSCEDDHSTQAPSTQDGDLADDSSSPRSPPVLEREVNIAGEPEGEKIPQKHPAEWDVSYSALSSDQYLSNIEVNFYLYVSKTDFVCRDPTSFIFRDTP